MPYSDNLYSANDEASDNESFSDELSPTDGFFNRSPMASNAMVPDPSLDRKDAAEEDKVLIPRSETRTQSGGASRFSTSPTLGQLFPSQNDASSQSNNRSAPTSSNTPSSPASRRRTDTELFSDPRYPTQGPPPAYTPSSPITSSQSNHSRSYNTFNEGQVEEALPANREPQSMGSPAEYPNERTPLSNEIKKPSRRRVFVQKTILVALIFTLIISLISSLFKMANSSNDNSKPPGGKLPEGTKPDIGLPGGSNAPYCASATIHTGETFFEFTPNKLAILQDTHEGDSGSNTRSVKTSGEIRVRKVPKSSTKYRSTGVVAIDTRVSDERLQDLILKTWDDDLHTMRISVPRMASIHAHDSCISLEVTLYLPEDTTLSELAIAATVLSLRVFDDSMIQVTGDASFTSVSGDIYFPALHNSVPTMKYPLDSRHITVETISGNIKGIYPLFDSLKINSQSGDINVGVYPQAALPSKAEPADLEVGTSSGLIQVNLPVQLPGYTPPARDYVTRIGSVSGDVGGSYFLGSVGTFRSTSGDLTLKVLPVIQYSPSTDPDDAPKTQFESWSVSGNQELDILEPIFISLLPSNSHNEPKEDQRASDPELHHDPAYPSIGDDDPYRHIVPPELNADNIIPGSISSKMMKRRRAALTKKWRTLTATHKASSASISVHYPEAWEGTVDESTVSADTKAIGNGLKIFTYKKGWAYKELVAGKGVSKKGEGSSVTMGSISGDLMFVVGEKK